MKQEVEDSLWELLGSSSLAEFRHPVPDIKCQRVETGTLSN
jgi:hypothetical protein